MKLGKLRKNVGSIKPGVRYQIMSIGILCVFLPLLLLGFFFILQARKQMMERYEAQIQDTTTRINSTLFDITTSIYTTGDTFLKNTYLAGLFGADRLSEETYGNYERVTQELSVLHSTVPGIDKITIYTNNPYVPGNSFIVYAGKDYENVPWTNSGQNMLLGNWQCLMQKDSWQNEMYELSLVRQIPVSSQKYSAYLVINLSSNYIKNRMLRGEYLVMACVDDALPFYASDRHWQDRNIPFPEAPEDSFYKYLGSMEVDGEEMLTNISTFLPYRTDNKFYILVLDYEAYQNVNHITTLYILILLCSIFVPVIAVILFSHYFSQRVQTLKDMMHQVRNGDYQIKPFLRGDDELREIYEDLIATVEQIVDHEAQYYQSELAKQQLLTKQQQMEFKMLASQINPHFLYNTLEVIRMQALAVGDKDVVTSIKLLGNAMHYVLETSLTETTTLYKELEYMQVYLSIQKIRFGDRINYEIRCEEGIPTEKCKILPLLLQPIIENSVRYGLQKLKKDGLIVVHITKQDSDLVITITDNGAGMEEETLKKVQENIHVKEDSEEIGIGLYNINQRIRLYFGSGYGLTIKSKLQEGTEVTMRIPMLLLGGE